MPTPEATNLIERLDAIRTQGAAFFELADEELRGAEDSRPGRLRQRLSTRAQSVSEAVITALIDLAADASSAVRRSPMLSGSDNTALGHDVKTMRAALRLTYYHHWDPEVLHDQGEVLGVRPAGQSEELPLTVEEARTAFDAGAVNVRSVLELIGAGIAEAKVSIPGTGSGLTAPAGYRPDTAFVMMWMQAGIPELDDVVDTVKRCFRRFGIEAVRSDDIQHDDVITKQILDEIRTAEFLFADLTGERPSVYYEVGYAHALGRRVMMFRKADTHIHFDLAAYNCPEYANLRQLEDLLNRRLEAVTGRMSTPKPSAG